MTMEESTNFDARNYVDIVIALYVIIIIRVLLLIIGIKKTSVTHIFHGLETLFLVLECILPQARVYADPMSLNYEWMLATTINFVFFSNNLLFSLIAAVLSQIILHVSLVLVYNADSSFRQIIGACMVNLCWLLVTFIILNFIIVQIGIRMAHS